MQKHECIWELAISFNACFKIHKCAKTALGYASTRTRTDLTIEFTSDRTTGGITMSLTATQTAALEAPARYVFDMDITDSSGTVTRVIEGLMTVRPNV